MNQSAFQHYAALHGFINANQVLDAFELCRLYKLPKVNNTMVMCIKHHTLRTNGKIAIIHNFSLHPLSKRDNVVL